MRRLGAATGLLLAACAPALRPLPPAPAGDADPAERLAAVQALARRVEAEGDGAARLPLVKAAVEEGQRCEARWPAAPACAYGLALALGLQARERPAAAQASLAAMLVRLRRAQADAPALDRGGPARVLALVLLRAPGWPLGPGDPEAGLDEARKAVALFPDHPPNQLALAEGLRAAGDAAGARAAARRALELARPLAAAGDPEAPGWVREAGKLAGPP